MTCEHGQKGCKGRDFDHEQKMMGEYGFFCHMVPMGDDSSPTGINYHTHGLPETLNHPDIQIVLPISPMVFGPIIHSVFDFIKEGNKLEVEKKYSNFLKDYDVEFAWAIENDRDVLRMILPDVNGGLSKDTMTSNAEQWEGTYPKAQKDKLSEDGTLYRQ